MTGGRLGFCCLAVVCFAWIGCASVPERLGGTEIGQNESPAMILWVRRPFMVPCRVLSARAAVYPSRVVIYLKDHPSPLAPQYMRAVLSEAQYERLLGVRRLSSLRDLESRYSVADGTEADVYALQWTPEVGTIREVEVVGNLNEGEPFLDRKRAPAGFVSLVDELLALDVGGAMHYEPVGVEVRLKRMKSEDEDAAPWPEGWPAPIPVKTRGQARDGAFATTLSRGRFEEAFNTICEHQQAVRSVKVGGRSYYFDGVRAVLPGFAGRAPDAGSPAVLDGRMEGSAASP